MKKLLATIAAIAAVTITTQAVEPSTTEVAMANEWARTTARGTMQAIVKKQSYMRVAAFAKFTAGEEFPNDPAKQQWFIGYVVPLTDAIMIYASQTILNSHSEITSSLLFQFFIILKDHPNDIEMLAKFIATEE